jgi:hypothetical protein
LQLHRSEISQNDELKITQDKKVRNLFCLKNEQTALAICKNAVMKNCSKLEPEWQRISAK